MTTVKYPIPYSLFAIYGKWRTPNNIRISDELTIEVADASDAEAPIVAVCNTTWPTALLPGQQGDDDGNRADINPAAEFRYFNGRFYAPVMIFDRWRGSPAEYAEPSDFERIETRTRLWTTPFQAPYNKDVFRKNLLHDHDQGLLPSLEQAKLRKITSEDDPRQRVIDAAKEDISQYLIVDGRVYRALVDEPIIRYRYFAGRATVSLVETATTFEADSGYFRLDRFDDCIDHVNSAYPGCDVHLNVKNIRHAPDIPLKFRDEAVSMQVLAIDLYHHLAMNDIEAGPELPAMKERLAAYFDSENQLDEAEDIAPVVERVLSLVSDLPAEMHSDLKRWNLRPVDTSLSVTPGI